jgi:hypothetical protein
MHSLGGVDMAVLEMDKKATRRGCPSPPGLTGAVMANTWAS